MKTQVVSFLYGLRFSQLLIPATENYNLSYYYSLNLRCDPTFP